MDDSPDPVKPILFATLGYTGPTALNQSAVAVGQQQRANVGSPFPPQTSKLYYMILILSQNIYAETTFVCPSYWLAEAFPTAYKYQHSVPVATHGSDVTTYFPPSAPNLSPEYAKAFRGMILPLSSESTNSI